MSTSDSPAENSSNPSEHHHHHDVSFANQNYEEIFPDDDSDEILDNSYPVQRRNRDRDIGTGRMLGYAVGHFFNDLCASMWFTYMMIYLEKVIQMHSYKAGMLMLIGQVTDAICTPLVGLFSDVSCLPWWMLDKFGRRISWHMIGTFCVALSFPFIFTDCLFCEKSTNEWIRTAWFIPFIMVFQFGWAAVQISHLALIPELSSCESSRTSMNSFRYGFTVLANLVVFGFLYVFLNRSSTNTTIDPSDLIHFRDMGLIVVGLGLFTDSVFYFTTREPKDGRRLSRLNSISSQTSTLVRMTWRDWFSQIPFYQVALLYTFSRLFINVSQVYFPFYITLHLGLKKESVAYLPMLSYICSLAVSILLSIKYINKKLNRKIVFGIAALLGLINCSIMYFQLPKIDVVIITALLGATQALLLISSLGTTSDLINENTESGAFVYGAMSLMDKLTNGIAYQIIELLNPNCDPQKEHCGDFYRNIMVFVPGACVVLIVLTLLTFNAAQVGIRRRERRENPETDRQNLIAE